MSCCSFGHVSSSRVCFRNSVMKLLCCALCVIRVVVLDKVTDLLLFFGKLLVVGGVGERCWWSDSHRIWELKLMTSGLISGVLAFFFFSGRIQTPGTTFETAALNYYWMPIIVRLTCSALMTLWWCHLYILHSDWSALQLHTDRLNFTRNDICHTCPLQIVFALKHYDGYLRCISQNINKNQAFLLHSGIWCNAFKQKLSIAVNILCKKYIFVIILFVMRFSRFN